MANENFKIVSGQSLYNVRNVFNVFIDALSDSGISNIIANPELTSTAFNSQAQLEVAGWEIVAQEVNVTGRYMILDADDYFRQDVEDMVHLGDVYTLSITINNQFPGRLRVWNSEVLTNPNDKRVFEWDPNTGIGGDLPELVVDAAPTDSTGNQQVNQTVQIPFITHETLKAEHLYIEFVSDSTGNQLTVETVSAVKGIFAFSDARGEALFTHNVRYVSDAGVGYWVLTNDNGDTYHRIFTASEEDVDRITQDLADSFYTREQVDAGFLSKSGDTAEGLMDFNQGALVGNRFEVKNGVQPKFFHNEIIFNYNTTGISDNRDFKMYVFGTSNNAPMLRYVNGFGWHYRNEDGVLRPFGGVGTGGGAGDANSEVEFFAEVLEHSGYKYSNYDTFSQADSVYRTPNVKVDLDVDAFYVDPTGGATQAVITKNIFDAPPGGDYREWFIVPLTDRTDNQGLDCFYSLTTDNTGDAPSQGYAGWVAFDYTQEQLAAVSLSEVYLKFEFADESITFHSFGFFYGHWPYQYALPDLRLREVTTLTGDVSSGTPVVIPNGNTYAYGEDSLEIYHNRARLIIGQDYTEIDENTVSFNLNLITGDDLEFFEKYTSGDAALDLASHIDDTSAHNLDSVNASINNHIDSTSAHGIDSAVILSHIDSTDAHGFDTARIGATDSTGVPTVEQVETLVSGQSGGMNAIQLYISSTF